MALLPPIGLNNLMVVWFGGGVFGSDVWTLNATMVHWSNTEQGAVAAALSLLGR
jgi:hypothetical protein